MHYFFQRAVNEVYAQISEWYYYMFWAIIKSDFTWPF